MHFGDLLTQVRFGIWRPRNVSYGIKEGVVGLSPFGPAVPETVRVRVREAKEAIRDWRGPIRGACPRCFRVPAHCGRERPG